MCVYVQERKMLEERMSVCEKVCVCKRGRKRTIEYDEEKAIEYECVYMGGAAWGSNKKQRAFNTLPQKTPEPRGRKTTGYCLPKYR